MANRTVEHLMSDVTYALEQGLGARDLVPMLRKLAAKATPGSDISRFAHLCLARHLLEVDPFRSAALSRGVALEEPDNDEAWGLYGLSLTVLGHYGAAKKALERACQLSPEHPGHAHNLGHLLDAGYQRPLSALPFLKRALESAPNVTSIACSYAHALWRVGRVTPAMDVLRSHAGMDTPTAEATLEQWKNCPATGD